jgi:hypothetical protein
VGNRAAIGHILIARIMVAGHEVDRLIEGSDDEFEVVIREIAAANNKIDIPKPIHDTRTIDEVYDLITNGQYFHAGSVRLYFQSRV